MSNHHNFDDDMASFDKKIVQFFQNLHVHINILKFFLGWISIFDVKIAAMNTKVDDTPSNIKWNVSKSAPFKTLITQYQDILTLRHMVKQLY